jgi:hypothetical protein
LAHTHWPAKQHLANAAPLFEQHEPGGQQVPLLLARHDV